LWASQWGLNNPFTELYYRRCRYVPHIWAKNRANFLQNVN